MGEQADLIIDQMMDDEFNFISSKNFSGPSAITCKFCGTDELFWGNVGTIGKSKWRLYDLKKDEIHSCSKYKKEEQPKEKK